MPGLDYRSGVPVGTGAFAAPVRPAIAYQPGSYYDGSPGRELVPCPDCGWPAPVAMGGDHQGGCVEPVPQARAAARKAPQPAGSSSVGMEIIRRAALAHQFVSANTVRADFEAAGIPIAKRAGALFAAAIKAGWLTDAGSVSGTSSAHGKPIKRYRSLLFRTDTEDLIR